MEFQVDPDDEEAAYSWKGHGWDWWADGGVLDGWEVRELKSNLELREEGRAMRHCVASYSYRCVHGCSAIFSLRRGGDRILTVEVNPETREVVQATGFQNRQPLQEEIHVLESWLDTSVRGPEMASGT